MGWERYPRRDPRPEPFWQTLAQFAVVVVLCAVVIAFGVALFGE